TLATVALVVRHAYLDLALAAPALAGRGREVQRIDPAVARATALRPHERRRTADAYTVPAGIARADAQGRLILHNPVHVARHGDAIRIPHTQHPYRDHLMIRRPQHRDARLRLATVRGGIRTDLA